MRKGISRVPVPYDLSAIMPFIMKRRSDSLIYYRVELNVEPLLAYIEENRPCTFFQAVLLALVKTMQSRPGLNRFITGRRLYQREDLDVCFVARRSYTEEGSETTVKVRIKPEDGDDEVFAKMTRNIREAKEGAEKDDDALIAALIKLPNFVLRGVVALLGWLDTHLLLPKDLEKIDPLHCSAFVSNLGSVGIDAPFHHLFEWGTCSLFAAIGKIGPRVTVGEDGRAAVKNMVDIMVTLDERIADGYYYARSFEIFREYLEKPETLFAVSQNHPE